MAAAATAATTAALRSTPDVYLSPALQDAMSRAAVSREMASLPVVVPSPSAPAPWRMSWEDRTPSKIAEAFATHGFVVFTMPAESFEPVEAVRSVWRRFCEDLSDEAKWMSGSDHDTAGYASVPGMFEQYNFVMQGGLGSDESEADRASWPVRTDRTAGITGEQTLGERDSGRGAYPWPAPEPLRSAFRTALTRYYGAMSALGREVVTAALEGLGVPREEPLVKGLFDAVPLRKGEWSTADIKLFRYLHVGSDGDEDGEVQVGEIHVDIGLLTLIPLASTPGLQAIDKARRVWVDLERDVRPRDLLVFPSDAFRVLTGGYIGGTVHRVMRHPSRERYSVPFILRPCSDARIATLPRAGTAFASDAATNAWDVGDFPRYDPDFRIDSFAHVLPSTRHFSYRLHARDGASGGGGASAGAGSR